ncbi:hypothetical protein GUITHDRAFT_153473 [Guillardia theta CCMP2712]|uniref:Copper transporter n=1 Tax=Guillardia theta (strain CCMP2712) TaxID=905079 RepID=L1J432_GUITC|nr:hypothetical protein GUITHDRAFT_153473 [Guillardia theta CCMP2712]EKX42889.1 hypothetical protein GUITHDRAFT_153473 [Guillardia theta CCMP2712]|mmetsp:Transcript_27815/g.90477  ORF Transcript_27815/g.90477 Transcript_27815/m.90477 type:complete len:193 (-) Transcript_27815:835-1413(-)|eukprot:XP_005829869.1 hypothetical protein GUITHDRAFT_153473 [Guillardia theta CCMP2712]
MAMRDVRWVVTVLVAMAAAAMAQEAEGEGEEATAGGCSFTATVPWTWSAPVEVDLAQRIQAKSDNPLALHAICKCPAEKSGDVSTNCECTGQNEDDCDAYSRIMAYIFLFMERFMGVIIHINDYSQKYHIENVLFWTILGTIFFWFGIGAILYSEIKAVIIARERDERDRLVRIAFRGRSKMISPVRLAGST